MGRERPRLRVGDKQRLLTATARNGEHGRGRPFQCVSQLVRLEAVLEVWSRRCQSCRFVDGHRAGDARAIPIEHRPDERERSRVIVSRPLRVGEPLHQLRPSNAVRAKRRPAGHGVEDCLGAHMVSYSIPLIPRPPSRPTHALDQRLIRQRIPRCVADVPRRIQVIHDLLPDGGNHDHTQRKQALERSPEGIMGVVLNVVEPGHRRLRIGEGGLEDIGQLACLRSQQPVVREPSAHRLSRRARLACRGPADDEEHPTRCDRSLQGGTQVLLGIARHIGQVRRFVRDVGVLDTERPQITELRNAWRQPIAPETVRLNQPLPDRCAACLRDFPSPRLALQCSGELPGPLEDRRQRHYVQATLVMSAFGGHHQPDKASIRQHDARPRHATPSRLRSGRRGLDIEWHPSPGPQRALATHRRLPLAGRHDRPDNVLGLTHARRPRIIDDLRLWKADCLTRRLSTDAERDDHHRRRVRCQPTVRVRAPQVHGQQRDIPPFVLPNDRHRQPITDSHPRSNDARAGRPTFAGKRLLDDVPRCQHATLTDHDAGASAARRRPYFSQPITPQRHWLRLR